MTKETPASNDRARTVDVQVSRTPCTIRALKFQNVFSVLILGLAEVAEVCLHQAESRIDLCDP